MAHITIELHEKFPHEHIQEHEYVVIREECASQGFYNTATRNGVIEHLPRACYFSETGTAAQFQSICIQIKTRLGREVGCEFSDGKSFGFGLKPANSATTLLTDHDWEKPFRAVPVALRGPAPHGPLTNALYGTVAAARLSPGSNTLLGKINLT